jgi:hypothetical protein
MSLCTPRGLTPAASTFVASRPQVMEVEEGTGIVHGEILARIRSGRSIFAPSRVPGDLQHGVDEPPVVPGDPAAAPTGPGAGP